MDGPWQSQKRTFLLCIGAHLYSRWIYNGLMRNVIQRKTCRYCRKRKRLSEFYCNMGAAGKLRPECKDCTDTFRTPSSRRAAVFEHYGAACACCGATEELALDHVHGDGNKHRRSTGCGGGTSFHAWLLTRNFPAECEPGGEFELQTLCIPCNTSKATGDHCRMHCTEHDHPRQVRTGRT